MNFKQPKTSPRGREDGQQPRSGKNPRSMTPVPSDSVGDWPGSGGCPAPRTRSQSRSIVRSASRRTSKPDVYSARSASGRIRPARVPCSSLPGQERPGMEVWRGRGTPPDRTWIGWFWASLPLPRGRLFRPVTAGLNAIHDRHCPARNGRAWKCHPGS